MNAPSNQDCTPEHIRQRISVFFALLADSLDDRRDNMPSTEAIYIAGMLRGLHFGWALTMTNPDPDAVPQSDELKEQLEMMGAGESYIMEKVCIPCGLDHESTKARVSSLLVEAVRKRGLTGGEA